MGQEAEKQRSKKTKKKIFASCSLVLILILCTIAYGYTQFAKKELIYATLQHGVNLENSPQSIYAITTMDQVLSKNKTILKGTRLIGKVNKQDDSFIIDFNQMQTPDGKKKDFFAKSSFDTDITEQIGGVSAKLGQTLYQHTKTNVLGAIFTRPNITQPLQGAVLKRGTTLKIEIE